MINVALVDINMPVMNGVEMIERLRQNPKTANLPIVVVSTESSEKRIQMVHSKGAGFIHKPFNPESIRETIQLIMGEPDEQKNRDGAVQGSGPDF
jgi:two-component system chemotaxis response regulator CheY